MTIHLHIVLCILISIEQQSNQQEQTLEAKIAAAVAAVTTSSQSQVTTTSSPTLPSVSSATLSESDLNTNFTTTSGKLKVMTNLVAYRIFIKCVLFSHLLDGSRLNRTASTAASLSASTAVVLASMNSLASTVTGNFSDKSFRLLFFRSHY